MDHEPDQRDSSTPTEPGAPTDPAEVVKAAEVVEEPLPLTEAGLARLMLSQACAELAEFAASMISPSADKHAGSGEFAENGRRMVTLAEQALTRAVVYERVRGTNWATIGEQLGGITKQSASARFGAAASAWTAPFDDPAVMRPDGSIEDERLPWPASDPTAAAASLDRQLTGWASGPGSTLARHIDEGEQHPVSAHLPRHSTMSALMTSARYSDWVLRRSFVPDPHLLAAGAEHRANLLERWQREGGADVTDEIATERARAAALRASIAATTPAAPAAPAAPTAPTGSAVSAALGMPVDADPYDAHHDDPRAGEEDLGRPDLSSYPPVDPGLGERSIEAQEWFLSDHPWAVAERTRRRQNALAKEQQDAATIRHWVERTRDRDAAGELDDRAPGWRESLTGLADLTGPMADETHLRASIDAAEPDEVFVLGERRRLENWLISSGQREAGYRYPAHLTGPGAADFPPPGIDQTQAG